MSPQQFSLRWNNHTKNLVQVFADQFEREQHVDVTISCQGRFLKAHKIVLGACSPYFQELFDTHESSPHPIIIMNGYDFEDVRSIVEFMYRGEVMVAETCMQRLLAAAEDLQIKGLSNVRSKRDGQQQENGEEGEGGEQGVEGGGADGGEGGEGESDLGEVAPPPVVVHQQQQKGLGRRRKRARTVSYDNEMKRKLRLSNRHSAAAGAQGTPPAQSQEDTEDLPPMQDKPSDLSSELMMTINIEPTSMDHPEEGGGRKQSNDSNVDEVVKELAAASSGASPSNSVIGGGGMTEQKEKIPRPPNSFMIFANEWRRQLASQFPNESNKEISVRLGVMWKNLTDEVKAKYFTAARRANDDHKKKYPDYHYNPKEARMRKMWKLQQQSMGHLVTAATHH